MPIAVNLQNVHPRMLAAVGREVAPHGVEVTRAFETAGEVYATETQGGEAAVAVHRGPYNRMSQAHDAIRQWMVTNRRESAGYSWEIYGDPTPDPMDTETTVVYLLKCAHDAEPKLFLNDSGPVR